MRQDQFEKLQALEEKLLDTFLEEADPANWPGQGIKIAAMDAQTRGDLYWVRKTAASVAVLRSKVLGMVDGQLGLGTTAPKDGDGEAADQAETQLDSDYAQAEREAQRLMRELQGSGKGKKKFDQQVHGRSNK
jgi:hypothetical protein